MHSHGCFPVEQNVGSATMSAGGRSVSNLLNYPNNELSPQAEEIQEWIDNGILTGPGVEAEQMIDLSTLASLGDDTRSLEDQARSYLHANCAYCHQPGGRGGGTMNLRFDAPQGEETYCGVEASIYAGGREGSLLLTPGDPLLSLISRRLSSETGDKMPPLGRRQVDTQAVAIIDAWIASMTTCIQP